MLNWVLIPLALSYVVFLIIIIRGWTRTGTRKHGKTDKPFVSIVIPVRDEVRNIPDLITCLENQEYGTGLFEVIFIDDHSSDGTAERIREYAQSGLLEIKVFALDTTGTATAPKKAAISLGVAESSGPIVLLTDGDVTFGAHWIESMVEAFNDPLVRFVSGPVMMHSTRCVEDIQAIEFSSLIGTGAAFISYNRPVLCNAANLAFRKAAFDEVNGYEGYSQIASGDDEFLMYKIDRRYPASVTFAGREEATVWIEPVSGLRDFIHQRRRWAGKWARHPNPGTKVLAVYIFLVHLSFLMLIIAGLLKLVPAFVVIVLWIVKTFLEFVFFKRIHRFFNKKLKLAPFIISSLIYSIYAVTFGILSNFGRYTWKGRYYKN